MLCWSQKIGKILLEKNISFQGHAIESEETVKLLGVTLDDELNFDTHISNLCEKAVTHLKVLKRLKSFVGIEQKQGTCTELCLL